MKAQSINPAALSIIYYAICEDCGIVTPKANLITVEPGTLFERDICPVCNERQFKKCDCCGKVCEVDTQGEEIDGSFYCNCCIEELFIDCDDCGERILKIKATETESGFICSDCLIDNYIKCDDCGTWTKLNDCYRDDNIKLCSSCYEDNYFTCEDCGTIEHLDNGYSTGDGCFCENCYRERYSDCPVCGESVRINGRNTIEHNGDYFHNDCFCDNYFMCEDCGEYYHINDSNRVEGDRLVCDDCAGNYEYCDECDEYHAINNNPCNNRTIHNYSYKPAPKFHLSGKDTLTIGIELEVEKQGDMSNEKAAATLPDIFYCKKDGSLNNGFEIVSHPFNYAYMVENMDDFNKIFDLAGNGFRSYNTETCGMHIHLSKKHFSTLELYKIITFINSNRDFILKISQRKAERLERWASIVYNSNKDIIKLAREKNNSDRYTALNMQNFNTIEFRIFRGTLKKESFLKNIEFALMLGSFAKSSGAKDMTVNNFIEFINRAENRKDSKNLRAFVNAKKGVKI